MPEKKTAKQTKRAEVQETITLTPTSSIDQLEARIQQLEKALAKIGTLSGYGNHLAEFGLKRWTPPARKVG